MRNETHTVTIELPDEHLNFLDMLAKHAGVARETMTQLAVVVGLPKAGEMILPNQPTRKIGGAR